ncbi:MAG: histidine kinase [Clostridiales bacterium]|nr:histidine kinase [Clostridiales bacterium]
MPSHLKTPVTVLRVLFLTAAGLALLTAHADRFWLMLLLLICTVLPLVIMDQHESGRHGGLNMLFWLASASAAVAAHLVAGGIGSLLLIDYLMIEACLAFRPAVFCFGQLFLLLVLIWPPQMPDLVPHVAFTAAVASLGWLLHRARLEQTRQSSSVTRLRLTGKDLQLKSRLLASHQQQELEQTRQTERRRMARGVHDTLGHTLTSVLVQLTAALECLPSREGKAYDHLIQAQQETRKGLARVRQTVEALDRQGQTLAEKLQEVIQSAQTGLAIQILPLTDPTLALRPAAEELVLSALQEGLTNSVRHGQATRFVFRLELAGDQLLFYLEDNGHGCPKPKMGYGLTAISQSAGQLGGVCTAGSAAGEGFCLRIALPARAVVKDDRDRVAGSLRKED